MPYRWDLKRVETGEHGTFGEFEMFRIVNTGEISLQKIYTVEKPWRDNKPFRSCIPAGEYLVVPFNSEKHGQTWAIVGGNVGIGGENDFILRSECLFHVANWADQVEGCVGPGMGRAVDPNRGPMVTSSRAAMDLIRSTCPVNEAHRLTIRWGW